MKKNQYIIILLVVAIAGISIYISLRNKKTNNESLLPSLSFSVTPEATSTPSLNPSSTPKIKKSTPTPAILPGERGNFMDLAKALDPLHRYFLLDKDCTSINPSVVDFPNNVQILLDNGRSSEPRAVKIGQETYNLAAGDWILINLKSATLPVSLPIYCGSMELGRIDLIK
jgi:hypothetical protein